MSSTDLLSSTLSWPGKGLYGLKSSDEPAIMFHPIAISTPANIIDCNTSIKQDMSGYVNHLSIDRSIDILNSTTYNQQHSLDTILDESMNVLPAGVASDHLLLSLGSTITEKSTTKKRNKTLQGESLIKENDERLNRSNFFLKNITTSMTYMDVFTSIATMYPLVQLQTIENSSKIQYLCVADTSKSSNEKLVSIHLCFAKKVNFKHKFLNYLFQDLKISDYLHVTNGDQFNDEIKLLANGRYIESSIYTAKKEKFASTNDYRKKQEDVAAAVFEQESFTGVRGKQIRDNIDYELQMIKKQKTMEYKPVYDPSSFKIPDEHQQNIEEWLNNDFRMRIDGRITRSRCLFMIGPTKHGKTSWARSLGKHNSFVINFSLADWRDDVEYIILDDVRWKDIEPMAKGLLIAPGDVFLTGKILS
ncbi:unnamed protein product [Rotaria sordida]|uniref:Replication-associated protein n=1 Tax=Rotaria sordida TaxID=392033 RepID=A0A814K7B2_9BILA|nr:unnamed protein product [Rotaria sordida]